MKVLVLYATNSGATFLAAETVMTVLKGHRHKVTILPTNKAEPETLLQFDLVVMGSNTWNYDDIEGQPHLWFSQFFKKCKGKTFAKIKFAVFALGDASYTQLAGAADHLANFVKTHKGVLVFNPIKIDRFYESQPEKEALLKKWAIELMKQISTRKL